MAALAARGQKGKLRGWRTRRRLASSALSVAHGDVSTISGTVPVYPPGKNSEAGLCAVARGTAKHTAPE
jgi:hypothetical protein